MARPPSICLLATLHSNTTMNLTTILSRRRFVPALLAACLLLGAGSSFAAITLTINTTTETYAWSNTGTQVGDTGGNVLFLGTSTIGAATGTGTGSGSITASPNITASGSIGSLAVLTGSADLFAILGTTSAGSETYSATGNGTSYSYASLAGAEKASLAALNNAPLYFFTSGGILGSQAGSITVTSVPEPTRMVLALGGLGALSLRRRRKA